MTVAIPLLSAAGCQDRAATLPKTPQEIAKCLDTISKTGDSVVDLPKCVHFGDSEGLRGVLIYGFESNYFAISETKPLTWDHDKWSTDLLFRPGQAPAWDEKGGKLWAYEIDFVGRKSMQQVTVMDRSILVERIMSIKRVPMPREVNPRFDEATDATARSVR